MKKILILIMSCNDQFFIDQTDIIKKTWASKTNYYDNIDYLIYDGNVHIDKNKYIKEDHHIILRCEDDLNNTFKKTYYAFNLIHNNPDVFGEYDYIFRTNTSTYVNIDLLNAFVQQLDDDRIFWTSEIYSLSNSFTPHPLDLYGRGNGMLFSKKLISIILKEGISFLYLNKCDDWIIGNILNSYWMKLDENYEKYIKSYIHGWFKCIGDNTLNNGHQYCSYGNDNTDMKFLDKFITIQIKRYRERDIENNNYYELWDIFKDYKYNSYDKQIELINNYSKNPSIFIGSILGYIDYNTWKRTDKMKLYLYEVSHKACDDEEIHNENAKIWC